LIIEDLIEINIRTLHDLWNVSCSNEKPSGLSPRLIFPKKRIQNKKNEDVKRISEQEARIVYCNVLNNLNYFYSVETPTNETYNFSGKSLLSALSDLSIYTYVGQDHSINYKNNKEEIFFEKIANVEFKALNPTNTIGKDIEKIIKEKEQGNWFHLLKNVDKNTLPGVFDKFIKAFGNYQGKSTEKIILFSICVLEKKWGMIKYFNYKPSSGKNITYLMEEFFCLSKTSKLKNIKDKSVKDQKDILKNNGWTIIEQNYLKGKK